MMAAPSVLSYTTTTAEVSDRIVGPVVATFAIVACWQAMRGVRLFNLPLGLWLVAAPWVLDYAFAAATWNTTSQPGMTACIPRSEIEFKNASASYPPSARQ